jgi:hypothetical protein
MQVNNITQDVGTDIPPLTNVLHRLVLLAAVGGGRSSVQYWLSAGAATRLTLKSRFMSYLHGRARMAKSADAADLKSAGRKAVGVQVPLWAP